MWTMAEPLNDAQVSHAWRSIHARADELMARGQTEPLWPVEPRSPLQEDDRRCHPWPASHAAAAGLTAGLDHLHALTHSITRPDPVLHARAPYTTARGCLENAAVALWIVHPKGRAERILRALRWYATDAIDGDRATREVGITPPRPLAERLADLRTTAERNGCDPDEAVRPIRSTAVMQYVDPLTSQDGIGPLFAWRLCSGFAHGRPWAAIGALENQPQPTDEPGVVHLRQTGSLDRLLHPALLGLDLLNLAISTYEVRATNHRV
jgi:hypothetical protein